LAHFTNNAVAVIGMSTPALKNNEFITGEVTEPNLQSYIVMAVVFLGLFGILMIRLRQLLNVEEKPKL
jgi:hypothetical protein